MNETEHNACFDSLGAYALGALPDGEREAVARHIETCPICAEDASALQRAATNLIETVPVLEPSPELRGRIMAVVESEAALLRAASGTPQRSTAPRERSGRSWSIAPRWVATAAALLVIGGVIGAVLPTGGGSSTRTISADAGTRAKRAYVAVKGDHAQLVVDGLADPPVHRVYELWVQHGSAAPQPAGVFVVRSGRVDVAARVSTGDRVMVTAEPPGGSAQPTGMPVVVSQRL